MSVYIVMTTINYEIIRRKLSSGLLTSRTLDFGLRQLLSVCIRLQYLPLVRTIYFELIIDFSNEILKNKNYIVPSPFCVYTWLLDITVIAHF